MLFCNGPQCPQSPDAINQLLADGFPAAAIVYYRGGLQDLVTLAMPTQASWRVVHPPGYADNIRHREDGMADEVTMAQFKQAQEAGAMVLDVRDPHEYAGGHVSGAQSLPLGNMTARMQELPRDQTLYVVCQSGGRSMKAADLLAAAGHDVRSVAGGTTAWTEAGGTTTSGPDGDEPRGGALLGLRSSSCLSSRPRDADEPDQEGRCSSRTMP